MNRFPFERAQTTNNVQVSTVYLDDDGSMPQPRRTESQPAAMQPLAPQSAAVEHANAEVSRLDRDLVDRPADASVPDRRDGRAPDAAAVQGLPDAGRRKEFASVEPAVPLQSEYLQFEPPEVDVETLLAKLPERRKLPTFLSFDRDTTMLSEDMG